MKRYLLHGCRREYKTKNKTNQVSDARIPALRFQPALLPASSIEFALDFLLSWFSCASMIAYVIFMAE